MSMNCRFISGLLSYLKALMSISCRACNPIHCLSKIGLIIEQRNVLEKYPGQGPVIQGPGHGFSCRVLVLGPHRGSSSWVLLEGPRPGSSCRVLVPGPLVESWSWVLLQCPGPGSSCRVLVPGPLVESSSRVLLQKPENGSDQISFAFSESYKLYVVFSISYKQSLN